MHLLLYILTIQELLHSMVPINKPLQERQRGTAGVGGACAQCPYRSSRETPELERHRQTVNRLSSNPPLLKPSRSPKSRWTRRRRHRRMEIDIAVHRHSGS